METERLFWLSREIEKEVILLEKKERKSEDCERIEIVKRLRRLAYENCELAQEIIRV